MYPGQGQKLPMEQDNVGSEEEDARHPFHVAGHDANEWNLDKGKMVWPENQQKVFQRWAALDMCLVS